MFQCIYIILTLVSCCFACNGGGIRVIPENDISIEYNNSLEITCCIERSPNSSASASKLFFKKVNTVINETYVKVLNETCIRFKNATPEFQSAVSYFCMLEGEVGTFCSNVVTVDTKPRKIESFECFGNDFRDFNCSWIVPKSFAKLNYRVELYTINTKTNIDILSELRYHNGTKKKSFVLKNPEYQQSKRNFTFHVIGSNTFGSTVEPFSIDHFAKVIPSPPTNLSYSNKTAHSALLNWHASQDFIYFLNGSVDHKIQYAMELTKWIDYADLSHLETIKINKHMHKFKLNMTNLPYAHMSYDVRVFYKSKYADNDPKFWSHSSVVFTTESEPPQRPPDTLAGSFTVASYVPKRGFYVYWKQINDTEKNGVNFTYVARDLNSDLWPTNVTSSYAFFTDDGLRPLNISIKSSNAVGNSTHASYVSVPRIIDRLDEPTQFTKIVYGNGTYNLSWKVPSTTAALLKDFTLFWCYNEHEMPRRCNGKMDFVTVPARERSQQITLPDNKSLYQFAISANSENSSSGMFWATCEVSEQEGAKVKITQAIPIGSDTVLLNWTLECVYPDSNLHGFNISYCKQTVGAQTCDFSQYEVVPDPYATSYYITKLEPMTTYSFKLTARTRHGEGTFCSIVELATLEGTPSEPRNIQIFDVGNSSMTVKWDPPKEPKGKIIEYTIYNFYSVNLRNVSASDKPNEFKNRISLVPSLNSYTNYSISITASTSTGTSNHSSPIVVRTAIGPPSNMTKPNLIYNDGASLLNFTWNPPAIPGGPKNMYEVRISVNDSPPEVKETNNTFYGIKFTCANLELAVRAINFDNDSYYGAYSNSSAVHFLKKRDSEMIKYEGNWTDWSVNYCNDKKNLPKWIVGALFFIVFLSLTVFGSRKIWSVIRKMKNLDPDIPFLKDSKTCSEKQEIGEKQSDKMQLLSNNDSLKSAPKTLSGSSENTDSTTLSWTSKGLIGNMLTDSPGSSNKSSIKLKNDDNGSMVQKKSQKPELTSTSKKTTVEEPKFIFNRATGYVTQNESITPKESENFIDTVDKYPPDYAKVVEAYDDVNINSTNISLKPKIKLISKPTLPSSTEQVKSNHPQTNLIEHTNALLNKHMTIAAANGREDDIITDPDMPPYVYSRFSWMTEKGLNNLDAVMGAAPNRH